MNIQTQLTQIVLYLIAVFRGAEPSIGVGTFLSHILKVAQWVITHLFDVPPDGEETPQTVYGSVAVTEPLPVNEQELDDQERDLLQECGVQMGSETHVVGFPGSSILVGIVLKKLLSYVLAKLEDPATSERILDVIKSALEWVAEKVASFGK